METKFPREFIRHPSDIPISYELEDVARPEEEALKNVSVGGLCFQSVTAIEPDQGLVISFPIINPTFMVKGVVVWCAERGGAYYIGVKFQDRAIEFRVRMVEQICHIEHYRKEVLRTEGRSLSAAEAAHEWIDRHAHTFPQIMG